MSKEENLRRYAEANEKLKEVHPGFYIAFRRNSAGKCVGLGAYNGTDLHSIPVKGGTAMEALESLPDLLKLMGSVCKVVPDRTGLQTPAPQALIQT